MSRRPDEPPLRDATAAEMKALAHPLRLRILRLVLDEALTNQQLAERVGRDPGTVLFHVRALERAGFIAADEPRPGRRGTTERPYRSTGKSWTLRMAPDVGHTTAVLQAVAEEVVEAGEDAVIASVRLGVRLRDEEVAELRRRLAAIGDEFAAKDDPAGRPIGLLTLIHRRRI